MPLTAYLHSLTPWQNQEYMTNFNPPWPSNLPSFPPLGAAAYTGSKSAS